MNDKTQLLEWRARKTQGEQMVLPSGLPVTVRRVSLMNLATQSKIPQTLVNTVQQILDSGAKGSVAINVKELPMFGKVLDMVVKACLLAPALADFSDDDHLGLDELDTEDKLAIFSWANAPAEGLRPFRNGQE
jgi:hypothetical protein